MSDFWKKSQHGIKTKTVCVRRKPRSAHMSPPSIDLILAHWVSQNFIDGTGCGWTPIPIPAYSSQLIITAYFSSNNSASHVISTHHQNLQPPKKQEGHNDTLAPPIIFSLQLRLGRLGRYHWLPEFSLPHRNNYDVPPSQIGLSNYWSTILAPADSAPNVSYTSSSTCWPPLQLLKLTKKVSQNKQWYCKWPTFCNSRFIISCVV